MDIPHLALAELLRDLAIGWKNLASYPAGHPRLMQSLDAARRRLQSTVPLGDTLTLGVLRDGLLHGGEKIEMISAQRLGEALHRRHVAVVSFSGETTARELDSFLRLLAADPRRATQPLWEELDAAGVNHIVLQPVDFEGVRLDESETAADEAEAAKTLAEALVRELMRGREALPFGMEANHVSLDELSALLGALFAEAERNDESVGAGGEGSAAEPSGTGETSGRAGGAGAAGEAGAAQGLEQSAAGEGGSAPGAGAGSAARLVAAAAATADGGLPGTGAGRMALGLARALGEYLSRARPEDRARAITELSMLVPRLAPKLRLALAEAVVRALGAASGDTDRERADAARLETFLRKLPPAEAIEALRRAGAGGAALSARTLRLAQLLAQASREAESDEAAASAKALAELEKLFRDDDIDSTIGTPPDESRLSPIELPQPRDLPPDELPALGPRLDSLAANALTAQLLATLLDLVAGQPARQIQTGVLSRLEDLYRELLGAGRFGAAMQVITTLKSAHGSEDLDETSDDLRRVIERLGNRESIRAILSALRDLPEDAFGEAARLVEQLGAPAMRHLLALLSEEQDRSLRHRLLGVLSALGSRVVTEASYLLQDGRWFVVRNMIVLLRTVGDQTSLPALRRLAEHPDLRVRLEAIKSLLAFDPALPADLLARAIQDPDPKLAESAINLVGAYNIVQAEAPLLELLGKPDRLGRRRPVRLRALRTLGLLGLSSSLPELDRIFLRERWFGKPPAEERQAAFRALAGFPAEARQPFVDRGLKSRDAGVRTVCRALAEGRIRAPERETEEVG